MSAFFVIALAILAITNALTWLGLARIHPRRRPLVVAAFVIGNALWPFFPILRAQTVTSRFLRSTLGPPWFGWQCWTIVYVTVLALIGIAWLITGRRMTFPRFARIPSATYIGATIIGTLIGVWQCLVPLRVEKVPITIANLPREADGMRIVLMGDLHVGLYSRPSRIERFFSTARALRPDVVILAGDLVDDDPYFVPKLLAGTGALDAQTPLLAVLGNHEMYGGPQQVINRLRGSRIRLLVNEGVSVRGVYIAGLSDYAARDPHLAPDMRHVLASIPGGELPIVVSHQPKSFDESRRRQIPLTLCAHTHGGQLGFRPLHWSLAGLFLPYDMGLYERGASQLYVNTGTGYWLLPFRLGMTPEITVITLHNRGSAAP